MEELQDAIEDAQYMNAMQDDTPKPTKEWKKVTPEERDAYFSSTIAKKPDAFDAEAICNGPLGLYLFMKYVATNGDQNLADFIMELANYRILPKHCRMEKAIVIKNHFLIEGSKGNADAPKFPHLTRFLKTSEDTPSKRVEDWKSYIHVTETPTNILHISGTYIEDVLKFLNAQDLPEKTDSRQATRGLFHYLDIIVFEYLSTKHYAEFKESPFWTKYLDFMCLSEQNVTEHDFTLFRVLGRGGFGLVNGCKKNTTGTNLRIIFITNIMIC